MIDEAFDEGYRAYLALEDRYDGNPYNRYRQEKEHISWDEGWQQSCEDD